MRARRATLHVARKQHSAIDGRTTCHDGYAVSLRIRRGEEIFGWLKRVGGLRCTRYRGLARTRLAGYLVVTTYNLVRMANLRPEPEAGPVPSGCPTEGSTRPPRGATGPNRHGGAGLPGPTGRSKALNTVPAHRDYGQHPPKLAC